MEMLKHELQITEVSFIPLCPLVASKSIVDVYQEGREVARDGKQQKILSMKLMYTRNPRWNCRSQMF